MMYPRRFGLRPQSETDLAGGGRLSSYPGPKARSVSGQISFVSGLRKSLSSVLLGFFKWLPALPAFFLSAKRVLKLDGCLERLAKSLGGLGEPSGGSTCASTGGAGADDTCSKRVNAAFWPKAVGEACPCACDVMVLVAVLFVSVVVFSWFMARPQLIHRWLDCPFWNQCFGGVRDRCHVIHKKKNGSWIVVREPSKQEAEFSFSGFIPKTNKKTNKS